MIRQILNASRIGCFSAMMNRRVGVVVQKACSQVKNFIVDHSELSLLSFTVSAPFLMGMSFGNPLFLELLTIAVSIGFVNLALPIMKRMLEANFGLVESGDSQDVVDLRFCSPRCWGA